MNIEQLKNLVNAATSDVLGEQAPQLQDLTEIVDLGKAIEDAGAVDNYVKKLVNHIGKVVFQNRSYAGGVPSVFMDSWEFGSILQKVTPELFDAETNDSWNLTHNTDYSPNKFYQPSVEVKFFNSKTTFEIPVSFTEKQVKESFSSAEQLNAFVSMLTTAVENSFTIKLDSLIMSTINNMVAHTMFSDLAHYSADAGDPTKYDGLALTGTGGRAVNLLKLYNDTYAKTLTVAKALTDSDFIRFATYTIGLFSERMTRVSKLFNAGEKERFTPLDLQRLVLLADFAKASETFLLADTFNEIRVTLPKHETVPYWQGSGTSYALTDVSKSVVKITVPDTFTNATPLTFGNVDVTSEGVIGVLFDRDALGVTNLERRVTTNYNPKAEFYTNFYKFEAGYFNDLNENFVVFFIGAANQYS